MGIFTLKKLTNSADQDFFVEPVVKYFTNIPLPKALTVAGDTQSFLFAYLEAQRGKEPLIYLFVLGQGAGDGNNTENRMPYLCPTAARREKQATLAFKVSIHPSSSTPTKKGQTLSLLNLHHLLLTTLTAPRPADSLLQENETAFFVLRMTPDNWGSYLLFLCLLFCPKKCLAVIAHPLARRGSQPFCRSNSQLGYYRPGPLSLKWPCADLSTF